MVEQQQIPKEVLGEKVVLTIVVSQNELPNGNQLDEILLELSKKYNINKQYVELYFGEISEDKVSLKLKIKTPYEDNKLVALAEHFLQCLGNIRVYTRLLEYGKFKVG